MKTIIFCTSYIDENNCTRYKKWIEYYYNKLDQFKSSNLFLIDDGSPNILFDKTIDIINPYDLPDALKNNINLFHYENRLGRSSVIDYPGWWRSFIFSVKLAEYYNIDKIIHIESDFYIVSKRMIEYIAKLSSGWTTFYSKHHKCPESAIQIICKDSFGKFNELFRNATEQNYNLGQLAEFILPFTKVEKDFCGDRFGEFNVLTSWLENNKTPFEIDYLGQIEKYNLSDYKSLFKF